MIPYTPRLVIASRYKSPALMFDSTTLSSNGITAHTANAGITASSGDRKYRNRFALLGVMTSFSNSLNTSAKACSRPNGPILLGPMRTCIQPITLRSHHTYIATAMISGTAMIRIFSSVTPKRIRSFVALMRQLRDRGPGTGDRQNDVLPGPWSPVPGPHWHLSASCDCRPLNVQRRPIRRQHRGGFVRGFDPGAAARHGIVDRDREFDTIDVRVRTIAQLQRVRIVGIEPQRGRAVQGMFLPRRGAPPHRRGRSEPLRAAPVAAIGAATHRHWIAVCPADAVRSPSWSAPAPARTASRHGAATSR